MKPSDSSHKRAQKLIEKYRWAFVANFIFNWGTVLLFGGAIAAYMEPSAARLPGRYGVRLAVFILIFTVYTGAAFLFMLGQFNRTKREFTNRSRRLRRLAESGAGRMPGDVSSTIAQEESEKLVLEEIRNSASTVSDEASNVDAKLYGLLGVSSLIVAIAGTFGGWYLDWPPSIRAWAFTAAIAFYVMSAATTVYAIWPRDWHGPFSPSKLYVAIAAKNEPEARRELIAFHIRAYDHNLRLYKRKSKWLPFATKTFALEMIFVLIWAVLEAVERTAPITAEQGE